jgi:hypothetical protein
MRAHSLRLECKKITNQDVVCRAITSDGELARDIEIQLLANLAQLSQLGEKSQ